MKKIVLTMLCVVVLSAASAQYYKNNIPGIRGGLNIASLSDSRMGTTYVDRPAKFGWNLGFSDQILLSQSMPFYFETGLYLSNKGGKWSGSQTSGDVVTTESQMFGMTYLQVPAKINYHIELESFSIEPFLGFHYALGLWGRSVQTVDDRKNVQKKLYDQDTFKRSDVGMSLGLGTSWSNVYAAVGWECGFLNISKTDDSKARNTSNFMITAGYNF